MRQPVTGPSGTGAPIQVRRSRLQIAFLLCGVLASLTWLGTDVFASLSYPGYRYPFDPISGLSAVEAPTRSYVVPLDTLYALLKMVFALGIWMSAGQRRSLQFTAGLLLAFGLTDLVANAFPWDPSDPVGTTGNLIHGVLAGGLPVLLMFLAIGFGAAADGRWFRLYSYGTVLAMILLGTLPMLGGFQIERFQPPWWFGAVERVNGYGLMLWMMLLAIVLLRRRPVSSAVQSGLGPAEPGAAPDRA